MAGLKPIIVNNSNVFKAILRMNDLIISVTSSGVLDKNKSHDAQRSRAYM